MKRWLPLIALLAIVAAVLVIYEPTFSPLGLKPRLKSFGVAQTQLLVDTTDSPLADSITLTEDIDLLASNFAEIANTRQIIRPVAQAVGKPVRDIAVTGQLVSDVALTQSYSQQEEVGNEILSDLRKYSILLRVNAGSFVVQVFTQAPTGAQAVRMANTVATALSSYVANLVTTERIQKGRRIILRQIAPAYGGAVDKSITVDAVILLGLAFFAFGVIALHLVRRYRRPSSATVVPQVL